MEFRHFVLPSDDLPHFLHPDANLNKFLSSSKESVLGHSPSRNRTSSHFCVVLGNEAADLDSIISSIVLAYHLESEETSLTSTWCNHVPVINIPRKDFSLRKDAVFLFQLLQVPVLDLVFIDDLDLQSLLNQKILSVILTDHNALASSQLFLKDSVIGIFDHHHIESMIPLDSLLYKDIRMVGSACSLIALHIQSHYVDTLISNTIASMLMSAILLDTVNFSPIERKTHDVDVQAFMWLFTFHPVPHEDLYKTLVDLRGDNIGFTTWDLFRRDIKFRLSGSTRYAISSISGKSLEEWLSEDMRLFSKMAVFAEQVNVSAYCLLTKGVSSESSNHVLRDLVCIGDDSEIMDMLTIGVMSSGFVRQSMNLRDLHDMSPNLSVRLDATSSRKRISPFIQRALSESNETQEQQSHPYSLNLDVSGVIPFTSLNSDKSSR